MHTRRAQCICMHHSFHLFYVSQIHSIELFYHRCRRPCIITYTGAFISPLSSFIVIIVNVIIIFHCCHTAIVLGAHQIAFNDSGNSLFFLSILYAMQPERINSIQLYLYKRYGSHRTCTHHVDAQTLML